MQTVDFFVRYALVLVWLLFMSVVGVLLIPFLFGSPHFNRIVARFGVWGLSRITRIRIRLEGAESLQPFQPCIYICNHQDNLDILIFGSLFPSNTIVIGKRELLWIPFFNLFYYAAGNIFLDRKRHHQAIAGIGSASRQIRERGVSVMIFPEGTRNRSGIGLLPFKKGAFHMAIETGLPLVPLVASPIRAVLDHGERRWTPGTITVKALEPVPTRGLGRSDVATLASICREKMLQAYQSL